MSCIKIACVLGFALSCFMRKPIKVLVVDDAIVCAFLWEIRFQKILILSLSEKLKMEKLRLKKIDELHPDVIVLILKCRKWTG